MYYIAIQMVHLCVFIIARSVISPSKLKSRRFRSWTFLLHLRHQLPLLGSFRLIIIMCRCSDRGRLLLGRPWRLLIIYMHLTIHVSPFRPHFSGLWKICTVSTPIIEQKIRKMYFDPYFLSKFGDLFRFDHPFWPSKWETRDIIL